ncbi:hypothetical protein BOTBODRAFT_31353 [Botryobasidium botryosum FD-172 SS1]|uniref:OPT superfamily oligopeptide transporter n=1 Tax=Botryobasidium botryosum (strain FD-172 SS1) TaxID=930990 RepID=A0A067MK48_BOTB1|nr:hypothetical protein BOTBODRAFT_31353 [Botryobasidium botryosum FD-172 SS1]
MRPPSELTFRAVALGLLIGCLLCFTNLYFGLQTGWISMMSLQSSLLGYLISLLIPSVSPLTPQENVILQTTAVATGTMPLAAGFVGIIPALGLLDRAKDGMDPIHVLWWDGVWWCCAVAFFGVFLAAPLRKQVIIKEQLAFPSGTATAQLISVLHKIPPPAAARPGLRHRNGHTGSEDGYQAVRTVEAGGDIDEDAEDPGETDQKREEIVRAGWTTLGWSFAASGSMTLAAYFFPVIFAIPLLGDYLASKWLWTFSPSLSYVGQGIIMGFPTTVSMNLGMLVGWGVLSPLSKKAGWAPGDVGSMTDGARGWILWVALAVMCAESVVSLIPVVLELLRVLRANRDGHPEEDLETETEDRLVPMKWVLWGTGGSVVFGTIIVWYVFGSEGIKPWATVLGFGMGAVLSLLGVRALGETDLNPVSGLGKISQLVFAIVQPGNIVANIIAGGVAEAGAQQAGDLMQDLKTGHLLHASPRAQFHGQLIGSVLSIFVTTTAYSLYKRAYPIPGPNFPAPTAYVWLSLARLLRDGQLPAYSGTFMLAFGILGLSVSSLKTWAGLQGKWWAKWVPSGVAFAIGFLNTPAFSIARLMGGIVEFWWRKRTGGNRSANITLIVIASGFVLGEGIVSVVGLVLRTFGIGVASCWGCAEGVCPSC